MRPHLSLVCFAAALVAAPSLARADCRASSGGAYSVSIEHSPASGVLCLSSVSVFEGATCGPAPATWVTQLGCGETRRMVISDRGALVNLRATRSSRRAWEIVRVFVPEGDRLRVRSVRLEELPGLPASAARVELELDAARLRVLADPAVEVSIAQLEALGRASGWRRLRRPS